MSSKNLQCCWVYKWLTGNSLLSMQRRENSKTALAGKQNPKDSAPRQLKGEEQQTVVLSRVINDTRPLRQGDKTDFSGSVWQRQQLPNSSPLSIIPPWGHLTFHPMAAQFPWEPLVSMPSQRFWKGTCISLSSDLVTAPRKHSVVVRKDSPSKQELGILFQLLHGDTDAKYSSCLPILALFPPAVPFVSLLLICQTLRPDFLHLVCLWKNFLVLLPCSNYSPSPLLPPYHILFCSIFFPWTQPQLSAAHLYFLQLSVPCCQPGKVPSGFSTLSFDT